MTKNQYRKALSDLGLKVSKPEALGIGMRQSLRYSAGSAIPGPLVRLLKLMLKHGIKPEHLES